MKNNTILLSLVLIGLSFDALCENKALNADKTHIPLYLFLRDASELAYPFDTSQLTVTPTATYTVNNMTAISYISTDGSCTNTLGTYIFGSTSDPTFSIIINKSYVTTPASTFAWFTGFFQWGPVHDALMQFRNGTTNVGTSVCVQGGNGGGAQCSSSSNCGWPSAKFWTP